MSDSKHESVPENKKGFTINASPLNPVKLELGGLLIVGLIVLIVTEFTLDSLTSQFLVLTGYGVFAMSWLIMRTRIIMKNNRENNDG